MRKLKLEMKDLEFLCQKCDYLYTRLYKAALLSNKLEVYVCVSFATMI